MKLVLSLGVLISLSAQGGSGAVIEGAVQSYTDEKLVVITSENQQVILDNTILKYKNPTENCGQRFAVTGAEVISVKQLKTPTKVACTNQFVAGKFDR